jgi:hypothetical protein
MIFSSWFYGSWCLGSVVLGAMVLLFFSSGIIILIYGPNMIAKTQNKTEHQIKEDRIKEHKIRNQRTMELRNNKTIEQ